MYMYIIYNYYDIVSCTMLLIIALLNKFFEHIYVHVQYI